MKINKGRLFPSCDLLFSLTGSSVDRATVRKTLRNTEPYRQDKSLYSGSNNTEAYPIVVKIEIHLINNSNGFI